MVACFAFTACVTCTAREQVIVMQHTMEIGEFILLDIPLVPDRRYNDVQCGSPAALEKYFICSM